MLETTIEEPEYKLGFNRSYFKKKNFSLMQCLNIVGLTDNRLEVLGNKIPEMKHI